MTEYKNPDLGNDVLTDESVRSNNEEAFNQNPKFSEALNEIDESRKEKYDGALNDKDTEKFADELNNVKPYDSDIEKMNSKAKEYQLAKAAEEKKKYEDKAYVNMQQVQKMDLQRRG